MPTSSSRTARRGQDERGKIGKLAEKSKSFHGRIPAAPPGTLRRPRTVPDLLSGRIPESPPAGGSATEGFVPLRLTKLLLNVTVQRSLGAVQVVMSPDSTVGELVREAVRVYGREGRRPLLPTTDPAGFGLHYSQFSLESLDPKEKLIGLGSRNFFLCPKPVSTVTSCSSEAEKASKTGFPWLKFMDFFP
ncbi:uncharacterized protein LOC131251633 [Magnolia sinica]|uniref:uncharacterized protein LOC131251633 n=1 Tax=Magnolia sinica TaxID=86752 RepID=UPI0026588814|nr:uncharacterized protein LOC131251633 [Magnolia sinica]